MKGLNEKYLYEILNEAFPGKWVSEFKAIEGRKFRCDAANPTEKICIEVEGGIWMGKNGGHTSGFGYETNMNKYNLLTVDGWRVLRYSPKTLRSNPCIIISHIRQLCGYDGKGQSELNFDGCKRVKVDMVQVKVQSDNLTPIIKMKTEARVTMQPKQHPVKQQMTLIEL